MYIGIVFSRNGAMAPFFMVLFWIIAYAVFGASVAIALAAPCYRSQAAKKRAAILAVCTLVLCYVWIPVVYKAGELLSCHASCGGDRHMSCGAVFHACADFQARVVGDSSFCGVDAVYSLLFLYLVFVELTAGGKCRNTKDPHVKMRRKNSVFILTTGKNIGMI